jgi:hypothetical protein
MSEHFYKYKKEFSMINRDDYGWFVRIAYHPISIRTLSHDKVKIYHRQVVFHQRSYLDKMPGFSPIIGFNPQDPAQRSLIRVGPPPEFQSIEISNFQLVEEIHAPQPERAVESPVYDTPMFTEINVSSEFDLTGPQPVIEEDDILGELDDIQLSRVLAKARQLVKQELDQQAVAKEAAAESAEVKPTNNSLNIVKEELSDYDNRKWYALSKKEACKFLDDAGIDHSHVNDTKWDKVNHLKEQVQG